MPRQRRLATWTPVAALALALVLATAPGAAAAAPDFPAGYTGYNTYAEMAAELDAVVSDHPRIASKFSIGRSYEGREIWALKISDNVGRDEAEPEVLFESLHHAREHLTVEMSLYTVRLLTDNYRARPSTPLQRRVSAIVDSREIFIVPAVNPDGAEFDIAGGRFHSWRKNRQPIPGSTELGVDLNRNWGYNWGCCNGSSANPRNELYRGPSAWAASEVVALRDFVNSRVVNGRQQIRESISWHAYGESVLWPYGYTQADVPPSMTADDNAALVALGNQMAATNGYAAEQLSDLYVLDGSAADWFYNEHRIMPFLIEMYPPDPSSLGDFYPPDSVIAAETARNQEAVLWFLEQAACPYRAAGLDRNCGPLYDDFETGRGWTVDPGGTDTATDGAWERAVPQQTRTSAGSKQARVTPSGQADFVTGALAGAAAAENDVDGGATSIRSPRLKLGAPGTTGWTLTFNYTFAHNANARQGDYLALSIDGVATPLFITRGAASNRNAIWTPVSVNLDAFAGQRVRLVFEARDDAADSLIEAAIDDVRVYQAP